MLNTELLDKIGLDPKRNPAVLDTVTWDADAAKRSINQIGRQYWGGVANAMNNGKAYPVREDVAIFPDSYTSAEMGRFLIAGLDDGQHLILGTGTLFIEPLYSIEIEAGKLNFFPVDSDSLKNFFNLVDSTKKPRALGAVPRLGIGNRMSTSQWPAVYSAMRKQGFMANAIQNSIRELCTLDEILYARECEINYLFGFGDISSGHTGNTFEGLWLYGVLEALINIPGPAYGADADHLKVKPGASGVANTKKLIEITGNYTFYTIDLSPVLNYEAFNRKKQPDLLPETKSVKDMRLYHKDRFASDAHSTDTLDRLILKYHKALDSLQEINTYIRQLKNGEAFDLELSIDEIPEAYGVFDQLTSQNEVLFLIAECERRGVGLTHIAPNFGVEKGVDYRGDGGYPQLQKRIEGLHHTVQEQGIILDCHSGDDLSRETRRIFSMATGGELHFKISPKPQELFADCLFNLYPSVFQNWWNKTYQYVNEQAEKGSTLAVKDLQHYKSDGNGRVSPEAKLFLHYGFAAVGKRDAGGRFEIRNEFYSLPGEFYAEYSQRLEDYLCELAGDLFSE